MEAQPQNPILQQSEIIPEEKKIPIANDVLRKLLEWIPMRKFPNVNLACRRFWLFCDMEIEERKYIIERLIMKGELRRNEFIISLWKGQIPKKVPIAEVEPPMNFKLNYFEVEGKLNEKMFAFLRVSKSLFINAEVHFDSTFYKVSDHNTKYLLGLIDVFDQCAQIRIWGPNNRFFQQNFFNRIPILNCNRLILASFDMQTSFEALSVLEWLHSPPTPREGEHSTQRQICFNIYNMHLYQQLGFPSFIKSLQKKFLEAAEDAQAHVFVVKIEHNGNHSGLGIFRMENIQTGEVLLMRVGINSYELVRCPKDIEKKVMYLEIGNGTDENPKIVL